MIIDIGRCTIPRTCTHLSDCVFAVVGSQLRNNLLSVICHPEQTVQQLYSGVLKCICLADCASVLAVLTFAFNVLFTNSFTHLVTFLLICVSQRQEASCQRPSDT